MLKQKDILNENDKRLRIVCEDVIFPFTNEEKLLINDMMTYLKNSQIEEIAKRKNLRPGMGLAANQLGINKRFFVIVEELEDSSFKNYFIANPKIVSNSEELIYAAGGEGCLSVNREIEGIVPRYARITVIGKDINGDDLKLRVREEVSIAFQHEIDHLNGILFTDYIDPKNPYKNIEKMREI